jgi:hypothetical protein
MFQPRPGLGSGGNSEIVKAEVRNVRSSIFVDIILILVLTEGNSRV